MPLLSICIPTYKRSRMLAEALESIIAQGLQDQIEVVVSDDASPDDTAAVAENFRKRIKYFQFIQQPKNLGMGQNFLACIAAARGDYIWLMGDDDRLAVGGAQRVIDALRRWPDVVGLSLAVIDFDSTMTTPTGLRKMPPTGIIQGANEVFGQMAEVLSFMSSLVVRRKLWEMHVDDPRVRSIRHLYVHVLMLGCVIGPEGKWGVLNEPCVHFRGGNDQLKDRFGWFSRIKIDVLGHNEVADALFNDDPKAHSAMRRRVLSSHIISHVTNAKTSLSQCAEVPACSYFLLKNYYKFAYFWIVVLPVLISPAWLLKLVRPAYRRWVPWSGSRRVRHAPIVDG